MTDTRQALWPPDYVDGRGWIGPWRRDGDVWLRRRLGFPLAPRPNRDGSWPPMPAWRGVPGHPNMVDVVGPPLRPANAGDTADVQRGTSDG